MGLDFERFWLEAPGTPGGGPGPGNGCGGGFYRFIWEYVLDAPVRVELLASVMGGDEICSFATTPLDRSVR